MLKKYSPAVGVLITLVGIVTASTLLSPNFQARMMRGELRGVPIATPPPVASSIAPEPVDECTIEVIDGVVKRCCQNVGKPGPRANCTTFSTEFTHLCEEDDIDCDSIVITCNDAYKAHAMNLVYINGDICLVEPQGGIIECGIDLDDPDSYQEALCKAMDLPLNDDGTCDCEITQIGGDIADTTATDYCSKNRDNHDDCTACCSDIIGDFAGTDDHDDAQDWYAECMSSCYDAHK